MSPLAQARLVLSGGIGCGKSTVGRFLAAAGVAVIDADEVAHRVLEPVGAAYDAVSDRWPDAVRDGFIDRAALAAMVFGDPLQLAELEAITHPAIRSEIARRVASETNEVVVVEVPLLNDYFDDGWRRIVVDAPDEVRRRRLEARGMTPPDIAQRMDAQPGRDEWLAAADFVIDNSGSLDALRDEVERFLTSIRGR